MSDLPAGWRLVSLGEIAAVQGGIQKQAKRRPVENHFPFLRVANVARGRLNLADVHEVELFPGELPRYRLQVGDLLVVEGNGSPDQIGRAAMWDGSIADCVHQNHLIRVRPSAEISARYLAHVWNSPKIANHLMRVSSSSSGLHTLSTAKIKSVEVPVPPMDEQRRIVDVLEDHLSHLDAAEDQLFTARRRGTALRRALLTAAFSGRLTGTSTDAEVVEEITDSQGAS